MESAKKISVIVILLVVIIGAAIYGIKKLSGRVVVPEEVRGRPVEMIDSETLEIITLSNGEWTALGKKDGAYKNPNTGTYTMVPPGICGACGEKIPFPRVPGIGSADPAVRMAAREQAMKMLKEHKCPRCGKLAVQLGKPQLPPPPKSGKAR